MAAKKKNAETVEAASSSLIAVDARKLSQGLKMTFEGMAMVFDSIGVDAGVPKVKVEDAAKAAVPADKSTEDKAGAVEETKSEEHDTTSKAETQSTAADAVTGEKTVDAAEDTAAEAQSEASEPTSAVSIDDITKIIVQKIKRDRKNNERIGSILKTYGVAKVGDLPASKYEAFLTDLSAI